jgi:hypothetical protein
MRPPIGANASDPTQWVPLVAEPQQGYPIFGWVTWDLASCYGDTATANNLIGFINDFFNVHGLPDDKLFKPITDNGFIPVSGASATKAPPPSPQPPARPTCARAVIDNLLTNNSGNNLNLNNPAVCSAAGVIPR